jgi:hypothetical protein
MAQGFEVKRQGAGGKVKQGAQRAGGESLSACHHQRTKGAQALALGEGSQRFNDVSFEDFLFFHISIILEILNDSGVMFVTVPSQWLARVTAVLTN